MEVYLHCLILIYGVKIKYTQFQNLWFNSKKKAFTKSVLWKVLTCLKTCLSHEACVKGRKVV